jgi:hypothetical protein
VTFCANDCCQSHSSTTILLSTSIRKPARNTIRSHLLHQLLITSSSTCTSSINIIFTRTINARSPLPHKTINSHMSNSASQHPFVNRQKKKVYTPKQKNIPIPKDRPTYLPTYLPTYPPTYLPTYSQPPSPSAKPIYQYTESDTSISFRWKSL